jgi:hypothetical protein
MQLNYQEPASRSHVSAIRKRAQPCVCLPCRLTRVDEQAQAWVTGATRDAQ